MPAPETAEKTAAAEQEAAPAVDLVDVEIDGVWHQVPKGTRMIEAVRMARGDGSTVPHYCYHPKLSSPGNCRMCLVQMGMPPRPAPGADPAQPDADGHLPISWMPRPVIACANTVAPNMGIRTGGELVEEVRKGVMEFLLINHPLDCPICDQAGECSLQEFSVEYGNGASRFRESKVKKPKNVDVGPRIRLDDERCIMCSRCIRFSREIADEDVLGFVDRGSRTVLTTYPGRELAHNYSLNTVDICPVGALTSNDFRFQQRVWFLKQTESICTGCGRGCNINVEVREGEVLRLTPRENNEVNSAWMCDHGRMTYHQLRASDRLLDHMIKEAGQHKVARRGEAVRYAAALLKIFKPGEVAIVASGRMTNEELYLTAKLAGLLGAEFVDIVPRHAQGDDYLVAADQNPNTLGAKLLISGRGKPGNKLARIRKAITAGTVKAVLALGEELTGEDVGLSPDDLSGLRFLLHLGTTAGPTAEHANVLFAGCHAMEKRGSMINVTGRLQRLGGGGVAPGNCADDWEILRDLLSEVGGADGATTIEELFAGMAREIRHFKGLNLGRIGSSGVQLVATDEQVPLLQREAERRASGLIP
jgi:NADH-quinone oxidoreductase subunit G